MINRLKNHQNIPKNPLSTSNSIPNKTPNQNISKAVTRTPRLAPPNSSRQRAKASVSRVREKKGGGLGKTAGESALSRFREPAPRRSGSRGAGKLSWKRSRFAGLSQRAESRGYRAPAKVDAPTGRPRADPSFCYVVPEEPPSEACRAGAWERPDSRRSRRVGVRRGAAGGLRRLGRELVGEGAIEGVSLR